MLPFSKLFQNLNFASAPNIRKITKCYNLGDQNFETEFSLSVPNRKFVENICHTFCFAQSGYDPMILGMFTIAKVRGRSNVCDRQNL